MDVININMIAEWTGAILAFAMVGIAASGVSAVGIKLGTKAIEADPIKYRDALRMTLSSIGIWSIGLAATFRLFEGERNSIESNGAIGFFIGISIGLLQLCWKNGRRCTRNQSPVGWRYGVVLSGFAASALLVVPLAWLLVAILG